MTTNDLPDQFLYSRKGPWPQPSPSHPLICADEVLNIPPMEELLFDQTIGARYLESQLGYPPYAAQYAANVSDWKGVTPERLDNIMTTTVFTRFKTKMQESEWKACIEAFKNDPEVLDLLKTGTWSKYDFSMMDMVKPIEGTHVAGTKVYLRADCDATACLHDDPKNHKKSYEGYEKIAKDYAASDFAPQDKYKDVCTIIEVDGLHIYREDTSFSIASLYALQGASYFALFVVHPSLHFPMDSVNAITKTALPMGHPIFQLFQPHSSYSLTLDNRVLESSNSVVNTSAQGTRFDPLTADAYNLKLLFGAGYTGLKKPYDPEAYPEWSYMNPQMANSDHPYFTSFYGHWLAKYYYEAFLPFTRKVAEQIKNNKDPKMMDYTKHWASYLSTHVNGFPNKEEIAACETLAEALAIYMWNASVSHGGDHWSFANQITAVEKCLRIRRPPPKSRDEPRVDNAKQQIFSPNDMQRARLAQYMFFQAWAIKPNLANIGYAVPDPELLDAAKKFKADLAAINDRLCRNLPVPHKKDPLAPSAVTTCQPLHPIPDPKDPDEWLVPFARTIPASIQY